MRLTAFTDFGLRALMRMASDTSRAWNTGEIADEFGISRHHLTKTIATLANAGIVETKRGGGGGARLAKPAWEIKIGEVVKLLERDQALVECFQGAGSACTIAPVCRLKGFLSRAESAFLDALDEYTLADCTLPMRTPDVLMETL